MAAPIKTINNTTNILKISALALQIAQSQIGQAEQPIGSNSGKMVDEYLLTVGLKPGYAWCQAFVYWCYNEAAKKLGVLNPVIKTAGVHDCWNKTAVHQKISGIEAIHHQDFVKTGNQFILFFGNSNGHTGIIEKVDGTTLYTIEGNSNTNGSREGYEVVRHQRNINDKNLVGFINY